jgi:Cu-Zn family superoxide dismutase
MSTVESFEDDRTEWLAADGGTALVIHAAADDRRTEPAGPAGARTVRGVARQ